MMPEQKIPPEEAPAGASVATQGLQAMRTLNQPTAPELAKAPELVKEPTLSVSQEELHPGITVHIAVANPLPDMGELVVQAPQHTWHQFAADARTGFNLPLAVAGSYRLTLRQPREDGEWREQAHLTVEVPE